MNTSTRTWVWSVVAILVVLVAGWLWYQSYSGNGYGAAGYGNPAASSTSALQSPTTPVVAQNRSSSTVLAVAQGLQNESRFAGLLSNTGVSSTLTGKGPYTLFIPTDASFATLPAGTINNLTAAQLKRLVQYHVVSGKKIDVNAQVAGTVPALSKDPLNFSYEVNDKSARVNSGTIVAAYAASNGIVYVINSVLLPPLPPKQ